VFFDFSDFYFQLLKGLLQKMLNYRLGTVNEKHWGFKPVFRCSKPHTFSTFSGEEKENKNCPFILFNKATRELKDEKLKMSGHMFITIMIIIIDHCPRL